MSGEKTPTPALEFPIEQIEAIIERAKVGAISAEEYAQLKAVIQTFALLKEELQSKKNIYPTTEAHDVWSEHGKNP